MTSPKHLWSGDWRADSAAAADELAARRGRPRPEPEPEPEPAPPPPAPQRAAAPSPRPRPQPRRTPSRRQRTLALIALFALIAAGVGYGLTSALGTSRSRITVSARAPYLGLQIGSRALMGGLLIDGVAPGSPADHAGVRAGDVLSRIGQVDVHTPGDVRALMQGRRPGDQVQLGIERGPVTFTVDVTLAARP